MNWDTLTAAIAQEEGFRGRPYRDTVGKSTIGYGRNLDDNPLTMAEGRYLMIGPLEAVEQALDTSYPWWRSLSEARQHVLMHMGYQMGMAGLAGFRKMLAALKRGQYALAAEEMLDSEWAEQTPRRAERLAEQMRNG